MAMDLGLSRTALLNLIHETIDANQMQAAEGVHIRLVVSRGLKSTPYQNPHVNIGLPLIVIIPEYKDVDLKAKARGLRLITSHIRRGTPDVKDEMWNHISKATDIQACIGANTVGADEALMLDPHGFVKTCNSTNFFIVRDGQVWSPTRAYQMQGITRAKTIELCRDNGIPVIETDFTLTEAYGSDEAFCTGTFPSHIMVKEIDGRKIGNGEMGPITQRLSELYKDLVAKDVGRPRESMLAELELKTSRL
jgi:branched-chain amino acid aminotransferase